jgi:hypothetical protein
MRTRRRPVSAVLLGIVILLGVAAIIPWAFHIGGRWTPLLTWWGSGRLVTKDGVAYPLFIMLYPSAHFSRLRRDGRRASGGVQGSACLCTPGGYQYLKLSGTIYGGWRSTEGSLIGFRLLEPTIVDVGQRRAGYFDLTGSWLGPELVMNEGGNWAHTFRSGLRIEQASVTLRWSPYWSCDAACAGVAHPANRSE